MAANTLNFALVAAASRFAYGVPCACMLRSFVTALPSEFATALLTAGVAFTYGHMGIGSVGLAAVVLLVFLYILRTSVQAAGARRGARAAHARARLAADGPAVHGAADAVHARRHDRAPFRRRRPLLARGRAMLGLDEREQDLIHTAALLHDIGKFILPDSSCSRTQAHQRRVGADQAPSGAGREARRAHRGLRPGRRDRPPPPRAASPAAATRRASRARRSRSAHASSRSPTPMT